jgi:hypothetical protein
MTPLYVQGLAAGKSAISLRGLPGYWMVGVGYPQSADDYVGRVDARNNRFVGHVVCVAGRYLIDVSADQMSRPEQQLVLDEPLITEYEGTPIAVGMTAQGAAVRYEMYPEVQVPTPKTDRILERLAKRLAAEWKGASFVSR